MRKVLRTGESALLLALMFAGALALWIGVPVAWLYIGSQVQGATHSVGAAIGLMLFGAIATITLAVPVLGRINEIYEHAREARGLQNYGQAPLEAVFVVSACIGVVLFAVWFLVFADGATLPIPDGTQR
jgi:hypothetical protein